jgi:hypothetical protein
LAVDCNIQRQILNVGVYGIQNTKKFVINHSPLLLLPLTFASWCLPRKTPAAVSQCISIPFSTVPLLILANFLVKPFTIIIVECCRVFQENNPHADEENEVSMT